MTAPERPGLGGRYDAVLLDLDGVVYVGPHAVPGVAEALGALAHDGVHLAYVTNNASRPPDAVAEHLRALGMPVPDGSVVTSAMAAADLLRDRVPPQATIAFVGGPGVPTALADADYRPVPAVQAWKNGGAAAVVMGYGPTTDWRDLAAATHLVRGGATLVATNTDLTIPTADGIAPGNGTLVRAVAETAGVRPLVAGKPEPALLDLSARRFSAQRPLVVGDRLDTDIEGALRCGFDSLLVLSGVTDPRAAVLAPPEARATYLALDARALLDLPAPVLGPADERRGRWLARVDAGTVVVEADSGTGAAGPADALDAVTAACAAAWRLSAPPAEVVGLPPVA